MNRGARKDPIFKYDSDCSLFLSTLEQTVRQFGIEVHAYSLMPNHYHLLLRSVHGNLSRAMANLGGIYTRQLNRRHVWDGPVFKGRFHNQLVDDTIYLKYVVAYIHLNPLRAALVTRPDSECWTSHRAYLGLDTEPDWLTTTYIRGLFQSGLMLDEFMRELHRGALPWPPDIELDTGRLIRSAALRRPVTPIATLHTRGYLTSDALAVVAEVTNTAVDSLRQSALGRSANPARRFAVWALSQATTLTQRDIGRALDMSTRQVANTLHRWSPEKEPLRSWVASWHKRMKVKSEGV